MLLTGRNLSKHYGPRLLFAGITLGLTEGERVTKGVGFVSNPDMTNIRILAAAQVTGTEVKIPKR